MTVRFARWFVVVAVLVSLVSGYGCRRGSSDSSPSAPLTPADQLQETAILPHPEGPLVADKNYVYCPTFQLAWNRFQDKVIGEPVRLSEASPMAESLARGGKLTEDILPPNCYLIEAGLVKDGVVDKIRKEMQSRFPSATLPVPDGQDAMTAIAFAYLQRTLEFREAFDRLDEPLAFQCKGASVNVACFGVRHISMQSHRNKTLGSQVTALDYAGKDDFIVRLNVTSKDDEIILAKIPPKQTLAETIAAVRERIARQPKSEYRRGLTDRESLVVPVIDLNVLRKYKKLLGKSIANPKLQGYSIAAAEQGIRFRLDEEGTRLESSAYLGVTSTEGPEEPRQYIFDKPFLIYLKRATADEPYLAMWVATPEVLEEVK